MDVSKRIRDPSRHVAPLAGMTALIDLDLRRTWAITDVTPLNHLRCQIIR